MIQPMHSLQIGAIDFSPLLRQKNAGFSLILSVRPTLHKALCLHIFQRDADGGRFHLGKVYQIPLRGAVIARQIHKDQPTAVLYSIRRLAERAAVHSRQKHAGNLIDHHKRSPYTVFRRIDRNLFRFFIVKQ